MIRGEMDAAAADAEAWERRVRTQVPYHPAGRWPERKVLHPAAAPDGPLLPGEAALLESLRAAPDRAERWALLYDRDDDSLPSLLDDPIELGRSYDPSQVVGPGTSWDQLATWATDPSFGTQLAHRQPLHWVLVRSAPEGRESSVLDRIAAHWPHHSFLDPDDDPKTVLQPLDGTGARLVIASEGDGVVDALQLLCNNSGLRDAVVAMLAIGGPILGREGGPEEVSPSNREDWMGRWFGQQHFDTEVVRLTPYMSLQWLDRAAPIPGTARQPLSWARFPEPAPQDTDVQTVESVDLGVLPRPGGPDDDLLAKALLFVVAGWVATRS